MEDPDEPMNPFFWLFLVVGLGGSIALITYGLIQ
jgi:hypothetical protein